MITSKENARKVLLQKGTLQKRRRRRKR